MKVFALLAVLATAAGVIAMPSFNIKRDPDPVYCGDDDITGVQCPVWCYCEAFVQPEGNIHYACVVPGTTDPCSLDERRSLVSDAAVQ